MASLKELYLERDRVGSEIEERKKQLEKIEEKITKEENLPRVAYTFLVQPWYNDTHPIGMWTFDTTYVKDGLGFEGKSEYRMPIFRTVKEARDAARRISSGAWRYHILRVERDGSIIVIESQDKAPGAW